MTASTTDKITSVPTLMGDTETMRDFGHKIAFTVRVNVDGISHAESLKQPQPAGNCINWVVGHLLVIYSKMLPMLGAEPQIPMNRLTRYDRGSAPIISADEAIPFDELIAAWNKTCTLIDEGLSRAPAAMLVQPVADSPTNNPDETIQTLLYTILFHQSYHAGQLGVLRRLAGKEGAIK